MATQNQPGQHAHSRKRAEEHNGEAARERGQDILRETLEEFKEHGEDVKSLVTDYIREKPFKSLGIALATGMALALFIRR
jgi:ElaB/YqjD/DUF883 family membrane-anchored ribosome-binding protein